ncbi:unnamed protein product [Alternaria alternata]
MGDPLYADLVVFSRNLGGGDGVRLSVFVGTAREASGLEVWIVSAKMNSLVNSALGTAALPVERAALSATEARPVCKACGKKNRPCQWEEPHTKFKDYRPDGPSSSRSAAGGTDDETESKSDMMEVDGIEGVDGIGRGDEAVRTNSFSEESFSRNTSPRRRKNSRTDGVSEGQSTSVSSPSAHLSPGSPYFVPRSKSTPGGVSVASLLQSPDPDGMSEGSLPMHTRQAMQQAHSHSHNRRDMPEGTRNYSPQHVSLTHEEALLVHHYTEHLGRWLDCTDATRQFTLGVPEKVKQCPVLCHAVMSFAARHCRKDATAEAAYQRCIALLIERLNEQAASHDETLLCAIVILRFYEQLNVPSSTGSDDEQHLVGCSAIIRSSQGNHYVDPSAPTLREAAFWVYVRQCLYNATINQQPPDIDFSLRLHPTPSSLRDAHPLARLRLETAWANQMTWNLACVVNFCFDGKEPQNEKTYKMRRWKELSDLVQTWMRDRPDGFNAIFEGPAGDQGSFPEILFTADWHTVSFGFYHFACIMLLRYKPGPKFAIRNVGSLSETDSGSVPTSPPVWNHILTSLHEAERESSPVARANALLGYLFSNGIRSFCEKHDIPLASIDLVGTHASGLRRPGVPESNDLNTHPLGWNANVSAETGISTVFDLTVVEAGLPHEGIVTQFLETYDYSRILPSLSVAREMFGDHEAQRLIDECVFLELSEADIVATVTRVTAENILRQYRRLLALSFPAGQNVDELFISGPSARNANIIDYLEAELPESVITKPLDDIGIPGDANEVVCYAHLALEAVLGQPVRYSAELSRSWSQPGHDIVLGRVMRGENWENLTTWLQKFAGGRPRRLAKTVRIVGSVESGIKDLGL